MKAVFKVACVLGVLCGGFLGVAQSSESWRVFLEQQLLAEEKCTLNYLTDLSTTEQTAGLEVKARAHCEDMRSFDVHKKPGTPRFELSACKPTYC